MSKKDTVEEHPRGHVKPTKSEAKVEEKKEPPKPTTTLPGKSKAKK
jgi:hypothetical protein